MKESLHAKGGSRGKFYLLDYFLGRLRVAKWHLKVASLFTPMSAMWLYNRFYSGMELALSV